MKLLDPFQPNVPIPQAPNNGYVFEPNPTCTNETCGLGTIAVFTCDSGYNLVGYGSIICTGYGEWNLSFPSCKEGKTVQKIATQM